jgi:hypothetical protein
LVQLLTGIVSLSQPSAILAHSSSLGRGTSLQQLLPESINILKTQTKRIDPAFRCTRKEKSLCHINSYSSLPKFRTLSNYYIASKGTTEARNLRSPQQLSVNINGTRRSVFHRHNKKGKTSTSPGSTTNCPLQVRPN